MGTRDVSIRAATGDDAEAILEIYAPEVLSSVATFELEPPGVDEMRRRIERVTERYPWLVFEREGRVGGYAYAAEYHPRPAYDWSCEVSVYVGADARGTGAGRALLEELLARLEGAGFVNAMARIALPNDASVRLFESFGFERTGTTRGIGYKLGRWIDVGEWQRELNPRAAAPAPPRPPS
ncbi:MAG TPA: GNAT family N-acetyltransferase [Actinomycetota bacterium]|nr:GNAT family N-acetyltransferase [Actinomycetota bacterium]